MHLVGLFAFYFWRDDETKREDFGLLGTASYGMVGMQGTLTQGEELLSWVPLVSSLD